MEGWMDGWMTKGHLCVPYWPLPDVAQMMYLTLQAVLGLETLCQWSLEMS